MVRRLSLSSRVTSSAPCATRNSITVSALYTCRHWSSRPSRRCHSVFMMRYMSSRLRVARASSARSLPCAPHGSLLVHSSVLISISVRPAIWYLACFAAAFAATAARCRYSIVAGSSGERSIGRRGPSARARCDRTRPARGSQENNLRPSTRTRHQFSDERATSDFFFNGRLRSLMVVIATAASEDERPSRQLIFAPHAWVVG